ncbi:MAG: hypothetical protein GY753_07405 [Gammaproteobacteria bacterium]|nr:hypothetical protein [Gammaproteobacteria bacterium]
MARITRHVASTLPHHGSQRGNREPKSQKPRNFVTAMPLTLAAGMGYAEEITVDENTIDMITQIRAISNS